MKLKVSLKESFGRLTQREKNLLALLTGIILIFLAAGGFLFYSSTVSAYEEEISESRAKLAEMRERATEFVKMLEEERMVERALKNNKITSLRILLNEMASRIIDEEAQAGTKLSDLISFEGKTHEVVIEKKGKKKGKKGKDEEAAVEIEQSMEFRDVSIASLFKFLDAIESSKELMFVTKLEIARRFNKMTNARANITVATYKFAEKGEAEKGGLVGE